MDNYPLGSDKDPNAPWKQEDLPEEEVEVDVYVGLCKRVRLKVTDYERRIEDLDGEPYVELDFSNCNLYAAASEQLDLDFGDWTVEELDIIRD